LVHLDEVGADSHNAAVDPAPISQEAIVKFPRSFLLATLALLFCVSLGFAELASAAQYKTKVFDFNSTDGALPDSGLIADPAGNLYGTASAGGGITNCETGFGCGLVYELSPTSKGWKETVLYTFCALAHCADGASPFGALVFDSAGNLYGTTYGQVDLTGSVVFKLTPTSNGWQESVLHTFCSSSNCNDGVISRSGLVLDAAGNLYGTTFSGGAHGKGVAFELSPGSSGWTETVLHAFAGGKDGASPTAGLTFDANGNLFGTAPNNGADGKGVVFELIPGSGGWSESIVYTFTGGTDGGVPTGGVIFDSTGNMYGTAGAGGNVSCRLTGITGCGVVFELIPGAGGLWTEMVLYSFSGADGVGPAAAMLFDPAGVLYGTTAFGGRNLCANEPGCGVVFSLTPNSDGTWSEAVLHTFSGTRDQSLPEAPLILDAKGNLYGTALGDPQYGDGAVFELQKN
jgi:uncharacterized repeat protein (TIGR03803 family)